MELRSPCTIWSCYIGGLLTEGMSTWRAGSKSYRATTRPRKPRTYLIYFKLNEQFESKLYSRPDHPSYLVGW